MFIPAGQQHGQQPVQHPGQQPHRAPQFGAGPQLQIQQAGLAVEMVACPHCQVKIPNDGALANQLALCSRCGGQFTMPPTALQRSQTAAAIQVCQNCRSPLPAGSEFCGQCGTRKSTGGSGVAARALEPPAPPLIMSTAPEYVPRKSSSHRDRKDTGVAIILSFLWTGLGQLYAGQTTKGIILCVACLFLSALTALTCVGIVLLLPFWIWGMFDASASVEEWNRYAS